MNAQRWALVSAIFSDALEVAPIDRQRFVRESCGSDQTVFDEVIALLAKDETLGSAIVNPSLDDVITPISRERAPDAELSRDLLQPANEFAGVVLKNRYVLERELGRGGTGVAYLATDKLLSHKRWVVKLLDVRSVHRDAFRKTFTKEIHALSLLDGHDGIVTISDAGEVPDTGQPYFVMQYVDGVTLRSLIARRSLTERDVVDIVRQVGRALTAAHEQNIWHLDLKPSNVIVECGDRPRAWIIDFGAAKIAPRRDVPHETTVFMGTPEYMAPEQIERRPCAATDTYALGVIAFEMLTGHRPAEDHQYQYPLPTYVRAELMRAISLDPEQRPNSPGLFAERLARALTYKERTAWQYLALAMVVIGSALFALRLMFGGAGHPIDKQRQPDDRPQITRQEDGLQPAGDRLRVANSGETSRNGSNAVSGSDRVATQRPSAIVKLAPPSNSYTTVATPTNTAPSQQVSAVPVTNDPDAVATSAGSADGVVPAPAPLAQRPLVETVIASAPGVASDATIARDVLARYCRALEALSVSAVKDVYATVDAHKLQVAFDSYRSLKCDFTVDSVTVNRDGRSGTVIATLTTSPTGKKGNPKPLQSRNVYEIQNRDNGWVIETVR